MPLSCHNNQDLAEREYKNRFKIRTGVAIATTTGHNRLNYRQLVFNLSENSKTVILYIYCFQDTM